MFRRATILPLSILLIALFLSGCASSAAPETLAAPPTTAPTEPLFMSAPTATTASPTQAAPAGPTPVAFTSTPRPGMWSGDGKLPTPNGELDIHIERYLEKDGTNSMWN